TIIQLVDSTFTYWYEDGTQETKHEKFYEAWYVQPGTTGPAYWAVFPGNGTPQAVADYLTWGLSGNPKGAADDTFLTIVLPVKNLVVKYDGGITATAWYLDGAGYNNFPVSGYPN